MSDQFEYRAFAVGTDGHYIRPYPFFANDDDAAIKYARQIVDGYEVEIWSGERLVFSGKRSSSQCGVSLHKVS